MAEQDKLSVVETIHAFLRSLGNSPLPLTEPRNYGCPESFSILSHHTELSISTFDKVITTVGDVISSIHESGGKSFGEFPVSPGPEAWVYDDLAVVWNGYVARVDGNEIMRGVNIFSLHKCPDGWKISGLADLQTANGEDPNVDSTIAEDVMAPIVTFFKRLKGQDWEHILDDMLPGSGITCSSPASLPSTISWESFRERLRETVDSQAPGTVTEEKIHDVVIRRCGDLAFVWSLFVKEIDGVPSSNGANVFTLLRRDGLWVISGYQKTEKPL